jgi:hypothetical protein
MKPHNAPQHKPSAVKSMGLRPGEGTVVRMQIDRTTQIGAPGYMGVDLSNIPAPERKYAADECAVRKVGALVKLYFGQRAIEDGEYQTLVVIHMSPQGVKNMLSGMDRMDGPSYAELAKREDMSPQPLATIVKAPTQTVTLSANLAISAMAGQEAVIDFLKASPFSIAAAVRTGQFAVEPIVRVDLSGPVFLGLVDELRRLIAPSEGPTGERK